MRDVVNQSTLELVRSTFGLEGENLTIVARAVELTAFYGDLLEYDQIAFAEDMSTRRRLRKRLTNIVEMLETQGVFKRLGGDWLWQEPLRPKQFLVMAATRLISEGLQASPLDSHAEYQVSVRTLNDFFSPYAVRRRRQFRGYLIMLEYLRHTLKIGRVLPAYRYICNRYGDTHATNGRPKDDLREFMRLIWRIAPETSAYGVLKAHKMIEVEPSYSDLAELLARETLNRWNMHLDWSDGEYGIPS